MTLLESLFYVMWRGLAIGVLISAPMGPVGILCIQRTLDKGRRTGFYTGVGAALSDLIYCLLTGFGLSFIEEFLERNSNIIQLVGSVVLIAFGVYLLRKNPARDLRTPRSDEVSIRRNVLGGFLFTVSNPLIIFLIIGLFARFNFMMPDITFYHYIIGFLCIIAGALMWWWLVTFAVDKVRSHFNIRSMWLINRIIGVVILLFALVGIVSGIAAYAMPPVSRGHTVCVNASRGFAALDVAPDSAGVLSNPGTSPLLSRMRMEYPGADFEFRFRISDRHAAPGRWYAFSDSSGQKARTRLPGWQLTVCDTSGQEVSFFIRPGESASDGISSRAVMEVEMDTPWGAADRLQVAEGVDASCRANVFSLCREGSRLVLRGGDKGLVRLAETPLTAGYMPDRIGWRLPPGAEVEVADVRLTEYPAMMESLRSPWTDGELLEEYLSRSEDRMEGYWQVLDSSMDEALLRPGGDYRLVMVRSLAGYDLIYLSGAVTNSGMWRPGMVKCRLRPSGISGIWNVEWVDAMFNVLSHRVQAQLDALSPVLVLQFPYHSSQLRLVRTDSPVN